MVTFLPSSARWQGPPRVIYAFWQPDSPSQRRFAYVRILLYSMGKQKRNYRTGIREENKRKESGQRAGDPDLVEGNPTNRETPSNFILIHVPMSRVPRLHKV